MADLSSVAARALGKTELLLGAGGLQRARGAGGVDPVRKLGGLA